jgi:branched-subunit amino acid transport protein
MTDIWFALFGMAAVTFFTRVLGIFALGGETPMWIQRWLTHVPVAVFTALVVPALLIQTNATSPQLVFGPQLIGGLVGVLAAWLSKNVLVTIIAGVATFWLLRAIGI